MSFASSVRSPFLWVGLVLSLVGCSFGSLDELGNGQTDGGTDAGADGSQGGGGSGATGAGGSGMGGSAQGGTSSGGTSSGGTSSGGTGAAGSTGELENGAACTAGNLCKSGFCAAGVCCDVACDGACMACTAAAKESGELDGECGPAKAGTDPRGDCTESAPESCGDDGKCDGAGACRKYAAGIQCSEPTCAAAVKTNAKECDGNGACADAGTTPCEPPTCNGNVCASDCTSDADCGTGKYCDTASGDCADKRGIGSTCPADNQCQSGHCVDGYCCNSACTGTCESCDGSISIGSNGTCAAVSAGIDPDDECTDMGATSCGTDGECDGSGACRQYGASTVCEAASCSGSTLTNAKRCNGSGVCGSNGTQSCDPYVCANGTSCRTSCSSPSHCISSSFCNGSSCDGLKATGSSCSAAAECQSGHCVDGYCCNSACAGSCKACSAAKRGTGSNGTCGNVVSGLDPDKDCTAQAASTCGRDGQCDGSGGCRLHSSGTHCASSSCSSGTQTNPDTCNGSGTCVDGGTSSCSPYQCDGLACGTNCSGSGDCVSTHYCSGTTCVAKKPNGQVCSSGGECTSGNCVQGRCCGSSSCPQCQNCASGTCDVDWATECQPCIGPGLQYCQGGVCQSSQCF